MAKKLKIQDKEKIFSGKYIKVWQTNFLDKKNKPQKWEWVEKADAVMIFPITSSGEIILIKNYRIPLEKYVIEVPAGLCDNPKESHLKAAKRELFEETGFTSDFFTPLPEWPHRSGNSNGIIYPFIANNVRQVKTSRVYGDDTEDITIMRIAPEELINLYFNRPKDLLFQAEILTLFQIAKSQSIL